MEATDFNLRIKLIVDRFGSKQIVEKTNISMSQLHRLKTTGETTGKHIREISNALELNPLWLLSGEHPMMAGDPDLPAPPPPEFTNDEIEMINLFRNAPLMLKMKTIQMLSSGNDQ